jgi:hypothetical protein
MAGTLHQLISIAGDRHQVMAHPPQSHLQKPPHLRIVLSKDNT